MTDFFLFWYGGDDYLFVWVADGHSTHGNATSVISDMQSCGLVSSEIEAAFLESMGLSLSPTPRLASL